MSTRSTQLKELAGSSTLLVHGYAGMMSARAAWGAVRGRPLEATHHLLRALRAVGSEGFGRWRHERLRRLVAGFCAEADGRLAPVAGNRLLSAFQQGDRARAIRARFTRLSLDHRVRLRFPREPEDPERQGDLIVLKPFDRDTGERGVLLVNYTEGIDRFAAVFDVSALAGRYQIVLEPSSWGYEDLTFLRYLGRDLDVIVQAPWRRDFEFIRDLRSNLRPTRIGAGDWTDPGVFRPKQGGSDASTSPWYRAGIRSSGTRSCSGRWRRSSGATGVP